MLLKQDAAGERVDLLDDNSLWLEMMSHDWVDGFGHVELGDRRGSSHVTSHDKWRTVRHRLRTLDISATIIKHVTLPSFINTWLFTILWLKSTASNCQHHNFDSVYISERRSQGCQAGEECTVVSFCWSSRVFYLPGREKRVLGLDTSF